MNKVHKVGEDLQLLMNIQVRTNDGTRKSVSVLVDTGAEANLVRGGLFNDSLMRNAREPLSFVTANGQPLEGGKRTLELTLFFEQVVNGQNSPHLRSFGAEFYEAQIEWMPS